MSAVNVDMHMYAKCDQNIPCGSSVMNIFTNCYRTDALTNGLLLDIFYARKRSHENKSTPKVPNNLKLHTLTPYAKSADHERLSV